MAECREEVSPSFRSNLRPKAAPYEGDAIDLAPDPGDAEKVDGVMNRLSVSGPVFVDEGLNALVPCSLDSLIQPEDGRLTALVTEGVVRVDQAASATRDLLDEVNSHIHRAGLLINTCSEVVRPHLVDQLVRVTGELDALINQLQSRALETYDTQTLTEFPSPPMHWAWSEDWRRWVEMTFNENQAWLARPDLDPAAFASHEVMS